MHADSPDLKALVVKKEGSCCLVTSFCELGPEDQRLGLKKKWSCELLGSPPLACVRQETRTDSVCSICAVTEWCVRNCSYLFMEPLCTVNPPEDAVKYRTTSHILLQLYICSHLWEGYSCTWNQYLNQFLQTSLRPSACITQHTYMLCEILTINIDNPPITVSLHTTHFSLCS